MIAEFSRVVFHICGMRLRMTLFYRILLLPAGDLLQHVAGTGFAAVSNGFETESRLFLRAAKKYG